MSILTQFKLRTISICGCTFCGPVRSDCKILWWMVRDGWW